jgi:hypothetical protein
LRLRQLENTHSIITVEKKTQIDIKCLNTKTYVVISYCIATTQEKHVYLFHIRFNFKLYISHHFDFYLNIVFCPKNIHIYITMYKEGKINKKSENTGERYTCWMKRSNMSISVTSSELQNRPRLVYRQQPNISFIA